MTYIKRMRPKKFRVGLVSTESIPTQLSHRKRIEYHHFRFKARLCSFFKAQLCSFFEIFNI